MDSQNQPLSPKDEPAPISYATPSSWTICLTLFIICLVSTNNYFSYHAPSATAEEFEISYNLNTQQFGTLFTIYSAPNIILVFFSGMVIDKYGVRFSSLVFNTLIFVGMVLCATTPFPSANISSTATYASLLLGRFLLGLGGESIVACTTSMISKWFTSTGYLNTAMAVNQAAVQLLGSSAAFFILPRVNNFALSQWVTVGVCMLSLAANIVYNHIEVVYEAYLSDVSKDFIGVEQSEITSASVELNVVNESRSLKILDDGPVGNNPASYQAVGQTDLQDGNQELQSSSSVADTNGVLDVLMSFSVLFWLMLVHIGLMSPILYTFTAFGPLYLQENFESTKSLQAAGDAISLLYMAIVAAPFTASSCLVHYDRSLIQFVASLSIPLLFVLLTYQVLDPSVCLLCMGLAYSVTESNALAIVSIVVPPESQGAAFGLIGCSISLALLVEPLAVGTLREAYGSFTSSVWVFTALTTLGAALALWVVLHDQARGNLVSGAAKN